MLIIHNFNKLKITIELENMQEEKNIVIQQLPVFSKHIKLIVKFLMLYSHKFQTIINFKVKQEKETLFVQGLYLMVVYKFITPLIMEIL